MSWNTWMQGGPDITMLEVVNEPWLVDDFEHGILHEMVCGVSAEGTRSILRALARRVTNVLRLWMQFEYVYTI